MLIGYARVSTADQDPGAPKAGCDKLFTEKASGAKANWPGLAQALSFAHADDCIVNGSSVSLIARSRD